VAFFDPVSLDISWLRVRALLLDGLLIDRC